MIKAPSEKVFKCVTSVGWNPHFKDVKEKTVEPHIIHEFKDDFYGTRLKLVLCSYIRPEAAFPSMEALVDEIRNDVLTARRALGDAEHAAIRKAVFGAAILQQ